MDVSKQIVKFELEILRNVLSDERVKLSEIEEETTCLQCSEYIISGKFEKVLDIGNSSGLLQITPYTDGTRDKAAWISAIEKFLDVEDDVKLYRKFLVLCVGIAALQLFVQNNWVGPPTDTTHAGPVDRETIAILLSVDGEYVRQCTRHTELLWIAEGILLHCQHLIQSLISEWWLLRCVQTHQALLEERSPTLKNIVDEVIEKIQKKEEIFANEDYDDLAIQFHLEAGHLCYFYYDPRQAKEHFNQAEKRCGVDVSLTGELGKRTRYQQKSLSQLVLKVNQRDAKQPWSPSSMEGSQKTVPKNVSHDDDTVLEKIKLTEEDKELVCDLTGVQQAVILGLCYRHRKTREGQGDIIREECLAYINGALYQPQSWCVQTTALMMRSQWEHDSSRLVQRSMMQLEELVNQVRRPLPDASIRLPLLYCCKLPPVWEIQCQLAALFEKVGAIKAALEVYERIQAWEDVIKCYVHIGMKEKADRLIQEQLAVKETPLLWCYLGDLHNDEAHYQKAWTISNGRFGRAQRSLGFLYLHNKKYEEALPCFEKSLKVNGLQVGVWFSYGCAALACQKYDIAAKALRRCVNLDGDNFQAWSNLATAYIRSNQKARAFPVLQEALKCEFESWQLWENYMVVSVDIGEFEETIRAYHRLLDLRDKHTDIEVLEILVKALRQELSDAYDHPITRLKPKILELFGRITSKITSNADIWRLYAETVTSCQGDNAETDRQKALQYLQKSHRCVTQTPGWDRDVEKTLEVLKKSTDLVKVYIEYSDKATEVVQARQMLGSAKLTVKGVLSKVKQNHIDAITGGLIQDLEEPYRLLEEQLSIVMDTLQNLQS